MAREDFNLDEEYYAAAVDAGHDLEVALSTNGVPSNQFDKIVKRMEPIQDEWEAARIYSAVYYFRLLMKEEGGD